MPTSPTLSASTRTVGRTPSRAAGDIRAALGLEYRFTYRSAEFGDFIEGIRAAIVDKDRNPRWQHEALEDVTDADVGRMLAELGDTALRLEAHQMGEST